MKNKNISKACLQATVIVLLIAIGGCNKKEVIINKSQKDVAIDKSKFTDKDWYCFAPLSSNSTLRYRYDSDGTYWFGTNLYPCGSYTWIDDTTISLFVHGHSEALKYSILVLENNYLKFKFIEGSEYTADLGMISEYDTISQ